jgi:hypothetical protein
VGSLIDEGEAPGRTANRPNELAEQNLTVALRQRWQAAVMMIDIDRSRPWPLRTLVVLPPCACTSIGGAGPAVELIDGVRHQSVVTAPGRGAVLRAAAMATDAAG